MFADDHLEGLRRETLIQKCSHDGGWAEPALAPRAAHVFALAQAALTRDGRVGSAMVTEAVRIVELELLFGGDSVSALAPYRRLSATQRAEIVVSIWVHAAAASMNARGDGVSFRADGRDQSEDR